MVPKQIIFFTYVDDRELQMYRLALGILGQKLGNPTDAYQTAQQIMGSDTSGLWNLPNGYGSGARHGGTGQQHSGSYHSLSLGTGNTSERRINDLDIKMSEYLKFFALEFTDDGHAISRDAESDDLLNTKSLSGGQTLLHLAASLRLVHFTNGLLLRGADPNAKDNNENTPLHLAALAGDMHIVNRLRLGGADTHALNKADLAPVDLAITSEIYQALLTDRRKRRTLSFSSSSISYTQSRRLSLDSSWCPSVSEHMGAASSESGEVQSDDVSDSGSGDRSSSDDTQSNDGSTDGRASLYAWRDQLVAQINAFQQSVNRAFPNLANLPPLPNLTDYHNHSMVKRITSLVPTNPSTIVKDSWDRLTGHTTAAVADAPQQQNPAPPAYEDLYPQDPKVSQHEYDIKQSSILEAAIDTAADAHFEASETSSSKPLRSSSAKDNKGVKDVSDLRVSRSNISRDQREHLRMTHEHKLKRIGSDLNLFLVWIPLFIVVMAAMLRNFIPDAWDVVVESYQVVKGYYTASSSLGSQMTQRLAT
ncbi:hypothetical protein KEM54_002180 [Ascosphaera aggregata]|nr:hypothetical protein KEM54_002180 [Ascosphaera aggregata]